MGGSTIPLSVHPSSITTIVSGPHSIAGTLRPGPPTMMPLANSSELRASYLSVPLWRQAEPGEVELRLLALLPHARRGGIGLMMLEDAARLARAAGMRRLVLDTAVNNEKSQTLYRRLGFYRRPEPESPACCLRAETF